MSVFTPVGAADLASWLAGHAVGAATRLTPIAEGVENTNYFLDTEGGAFVLTLFERLPAADLPFYLGLMRRLAERQVAAPAPVADRAGALFAPLCGKPAALVTRLAGRAIEAPTAGHCATIGDWLARMHRALADFPGAPANPRGAAWRAATAGAVRPFLDADARALLDRGLQNFDRVATWAAPLPRGVVHADLFRDNALWQGERLAGVIDFYFAGEDEWLFDLAVTVNDWCLAADGHSLDGARCAALLDAYHARRPLGANERAAWPTLLGRAALRFWLSRLADLHLPRVGDLVKVKDPDAYQAILADRLARAESPPWLSR